MKIQLERTEQVFALLDQTPGTEPDDGMKTTLKAGESALKRTSPSSLKDAALIAVAHDAAHQRLASYCMLHTWGQLLKRPDIVQLLEWTLEEEKSRDAQLMPIVSTLSIQSAAAVSR